MHDHDFQLMATEETASGDIVYTVRIHALNLERQYAYSPATDSIAITGQERSIRVGGHDMTSIIGKRVREWLRSTVVPPTNPKGQCSHDSAPVPDHRKPPP